MSASIRSPDTPDGPSICWESDHRRRPVRRVAVAIASDTRSETATAAAITTASLVEGELLVIHVRSWVPTPPSIGEDEGLSIDNGDTFTETAEEAAWVIDAAVKAAHDRGVRALGVVLEAPCTLIAPSVLDAAARWRTDLLVLARRPRRSISRFLFGSISDLVARDASCPVLLVQSPPVGP